MAKPIKVEQHSSLGVLWFIGWLYSIGFLGLGFWKGLLALFIWPYFLGSHMADNVEAATASPVSVQQQTGLQ